MIQCQQYFLVLIWLILNVCKRQLTSTIISNDSIKFTRIQELLPTTQQFIAEKLKKEHVMELASRKRTQLQMKICSSLSKNKLYSQKAVAAL